LRRQSSDATSYELLALTRFIFQRNHYSSTGVKPAAFLPPPNRFVISMLFIDGMRHAEMWGIGDRIGQERAKRAIARAGLMKSAVLTIGLSVELSPGVHANHADVGGWPPEKDAQKLIALELCARSSLHLRPLGI
jgi:hypothetical protein